LRKLLGALAFSLTIAFGISAPGVAAASPAGAGLSTAKIVIIVGPVEGTTASYIADAKATAIVARQYSSKVVTIYSPSATWANVEPALQGASIVVYFGHGNGWPSPYKPFQEDTKDGLGLNTAKSPSNNAHTYYGANYLENYIKLAPNAVVILGHLCYSAGNSEAQDPAPTLAVAEQRVDNMGAGWLQTGARAVISEPYSTNEGSYIQDIFTTHESIFSMWQAAPGANSNVQTWPSARISWSSVNLDTDPNVTGNDHFDRAMSGDPTLSTDAILSSSRSAFLRVALGQFNPVGRSAFGTTWVGSLRAQ
jgi:hypothetical protein